jgi:hypothetical protein
MASFSQSVLSYRDVHQAFEAAGRVGTITLRFETSAKATTWVGRANAYRVLLRKQNKEAGRDHACEFDHLMVRRKPGNSIVTIEPRGFDFIVELPDGTPIDLDKATIQGPVPTPHEITLAEEEAERFLREYEAEQKGADK